MARDITYADHEQVVKSMPHDPSWHPEALKSHGLGYISIAGRLQDATQQVHYALHTPKTQLPGNLTDAQYEQRCAILGLAYKILEADTARAMDEAVSFWIEYRKRS